MLQLLDEFAQAWNRHDTGAIMEMMTADCVFESSAGSTVAGERYEGQAAVRAAFETLEREPDKFAKLESIVVNEPIRRCLLRGFPYLVIYELFDDEVFVYSVAHASRRPNYWRRRKRDK